MRSGIRHQEFECISDTAHKGELQGKAKKQLLS